MSFILGFGKAEEDFERQEFDFVRDFVTKKVENFKGLEYEFTFNAELVSELKASLSEREREYRRLDKEYKVSETYPDRYSRYWFNIVYDACDLCVVFHFFHTNRKHWLSPDGWAALTADKVCHINGQSIRRACLEG